jgi:hypothetical protein
VPAAWPPHCRPAIPRPGCWPPAASSTPTCGPTCSAARWPSTPAPPSV